MNLAFALLFLVACQLCSAQESEETPTSSTIFSSSSLASNYWSEKSTVNSESTPPLDTTQATSSLVTSSSGWDWGWEDETASSIVTSSTLTYSDWSDATSVSSAVWDWEPVPTSSTIVASTSVPSIETLFVYLYEALERDHLGLRRKRRDVEAQIVPEKNELMKRKAPGLKSKDFVREMLRRAGMKKRFS